jgi:hypothetical protein
MHGEFCSALGRVRVRQACALTSPDRLKTPLHTAGRYSSTLQRGRSAARHSNVCSRCRPRKQPGWLRLRRPYRHQRPFRRNQHAQDTSWMSGSSGTKRALSRTTQGTCSPGDTGAPRLCNTSSQQQLVRESTAHAQALAATCVSCFTASCRENEETKRRFVGRRGSLSAGLRGCVKRWRRPNRSNMQHAVLRQGACVGSLSDLACAVRLPLRLHNLVTVSGLLDHMHMLRPRPATEAELARCALTP